MSTNFNAFLGVGSIDPLLQWLDRIGLKTLLLVRSVQIWDMHNSILTIMSPAAGTETVSKSMKGDMEWSLSEECGPLGDNALHQTQRQKLSELLQGLGLGLRQLRMQRRGSALIHRTSVYVLAHLDSSDSCIAARR